MNLLNSLKVQLVLQERIKCTVKMCTKERPYLTRVLLSGKIYLRGVGKTEAIRKQIELPRRGRIDWEGISWTVDCLMSDAGRIEQLSK